MTGIQEQRTGLEVTNPRLKDSTTLGPDGATRQSGKESRGGAGGPWDGVC